MRIVSVFTSLLAFTALGLSASLLSAQASDKKAPPAEMSTVPGNSAGGTGKAAYIAGWNLRQCANGSYRYVSATSSIFRAENVDGSYIQQTITGTPTVGAGQAALIAVCNRGALYWVYCPTTACSWTQLDTGY
jgi:hypothetical protein